MTITHCCYFWSRVCVMHILIISHQVLKTFLPNHYSYKKVGFGMFVCKCRARALYFLEMRCVWLSPHALLTDILPVLGDVPWLQEECEEIKNHECPAGWETIVISVTNITEWAPHPSHLLYSTLSPQHLYLRTQLYFTY